MQQSQKSVLEISPLGRVEKLLLGIDASSLGIEIGPGYNPILPKAKGYNVKNVDHASAEDLRKKYKAIGVDVSNIEEVDYIWAGEKLGDLIDNSGEIEFIIASHVIEHAPDFVDFIA